MFDDQRGVGFTASCDNAVTAFDKTIESYLSLSSDAGPNLKSVFEADPNMVMAHCLKGYFFLLMGSGPLIPRARKAFDQARKSVEATSQREQAHVKALGLWCDDRPQAAGRVWEDILDDHPRDILAQRLAHHTHFYAGDGVAMYASLERTSSAWTDGDPGYGYILGMRAFALEESGNYGDAETTGRKAVDVTPDNPWAIHAVAHVMEMQSRTTEGLAWITGLEPHWVGGNNFRYHLWWHRALMHLDQGDTDQVLRLYDDVLWDEESDEYLDLCNDVALLSRLEFQGIDVGERWHPLADKIKGRTEEHILSFADAHYAIALAAVGDDASADHLVDTLTSKGGTLRRDVGLPLCRAMVAHRRGEFAAALSELNRIHDDIHNVGGSHAQRDLFEQVLVDAAIKSGDLDQASSLLMQRTTQKPNNAMSWYRLADVLAAKGDDVSAVEARSKADALIAA